MDSKDTFEVDSSIIILGDWFPNHFLSSAKGRVIVSLFSSKPYENITDLPLDKMVAISPTMCSDVISWMKILYFD